MFRSGNFVYSFVKGQASNAASGFQGGSELINAGAKYYALDGWPIWSTMASYANAVLPYAVATGEAAAIGYLDKCTGARDCSELNALIPNSHSQTWKW
ncbi:MAG: hypothetical protein JNL11_11870 [Bdellovibrionaceae bacterium]|nr:hypothetical protein [Pseudobdellovibrionaceae bacterium]